MFPSQDLPRKFLSLGILAAIVLHALQLLWPASGIVAVVCIVIVAMRTGAWGASKVLMREAHAVLLGAAIVLLPSFGSNAVMTALLTFLFCERRNLPKKWLLPLLPIGVVALGWITTELWCEQTLHAAWHVLSRAGAGSFAARMWGLCAWLRGNSTAPILAIDWLIRISMMMGVAAVFAQEPRKGAAVRSGLIIGMVVAIPIGLWQVYMMYAAHGPILVTHSSSSFWDALRRISATFSDPNAFGVASVLLLPLISDHSRQYGQKGRVLVRTVVLVWLGLVFFSGSRTGALGLALIGAFAVVRRKSTALACGMILLMGVALLNFSPTIQASISSSVIPESLRRVANSLVISNLSQTLFSRALFLEMSSHLMASNLWVGIGLERYRDFVVPLSFGREGVLPLWTDNSNNFYLGIVVELGLLGALCALGVASLFWIHQRSSRLLRITLGIFLALLLFGPHIDFPEVAALSGILLAGTVEPRPRPAYLGLLVAGACGLLPAIAVRGYFGQYGFYGWEQDGARYLRWSGVRAQGWVRCAAQTTSTELFLRAPQASVSSPVEVTVAPLGLPSETYALASDGIRSISLLCPNQPQEIFVPYRLSVKGSYFPWGRKMSGDARVLGVQVLTTNPPSTLPF